MLNTTPHMEILTGTFCPATHGSVHFALIKVLYGGVIPLRGSAVSIGSIGLDTSVSVGASDSALVHLGKMIMRKLAMDFLRNLLLIVEARISGPLNGNLRDNALSEPPSTLVLLFTVDSTPTVEVFLDHLLAVVEDVNVADTVNIHELVHCIFACRIHNLGDLVEG